MDRRWLEAQLGAGRSIESIAREVGKHPSTVAYWVNKHGLASAHAEKHASTGGLDRERLAVLVEDGLTVQQLAEAFSVGATTVRYWLHRFGLRTVRSRHLGDAVVGQKVVMRRCRHHGYTAWALTGTGGRYRCKLCRTELVTERRRRVKRILVAEAGGRCRLCGYDRYAGALQFHHLDPSTKSFALSVQGVARSLSKAREEAKKCALICANCHAEVEAGLATIPP
jgi:transposase